MIKDGVDGFVVPLYGKEMMAERIVELLRDDALRQRMSRRCRRRMLETYGWDIIAAETERLYREVIDDPKNLKGACRAGRPCLEDGP